MNFHASIFRPVFIGLLSGIAAHAAEPPTDVTFTGNAISSISSGVAIPTGRAHFWTSGTVPSVVNAAGTTGRERFGDTYTQAVSCLKNISTVLEQQGLALQDVVYLRVYVTPDPALGGKPDFAGWFKAYGEFFNCAANPVKTARSTIGVSALVNPDWLIEIEAMAVYPADR